MIVTFIPSSRTKAKVVKKELQTKSTPRKPSVDAADVQREFAKFQVQLNEQLDSMEE